MNAVVLIICRMSLPLQELPEPFRTMLEVMVKFIKEQGGLSSSSVATERTNQRPNSSRYYCLDLLIILHANTVK